MRTKTNPLQLSCPCSNVERCTQTLQPPTLGWLTVWCWKRLERKVNSLQPKLRQPRGNRSQTGSKKHEEVVESILLSVVVTPISSGSAHLQQTVKNSSSRGGWYCKGNELMRQKYWDQFSISFNFFSRFILSSLTVLFTLFTISSRIEPFHYQFESSFLSVGCCNFNLF